jgi:hypothetical protein
VNNHLPHDGGMTAGEIDRKVDTAALERGLMGEGIKKFAEPQKALLRLITRQRTSFSTGSQR